jgi:hypothetical protein
MAGLGACRDMAVRVQEKVEKSEKSRAPGSKWEPGAPGYRTLKLTEAFILFSGGHPRSEQTCKANSLAACAFSSRRDSTAVRPLGGFDSGNWHPHRLQAYPVSATDAAIRGLFISTVSSAIAFVGTSCDFNMYYRITR